MHLSIHAVSGIGIIEPVKLSTELGWLRRIKIRTNRGEYIEIAIFADGPDSLELQPEEGE